MEQFIVIVIMILSEILSSKGSCKRQVISNPVWKSLNYERWLGDVAIFRYNHFVDKLNETTKGMRLENGTMLNIEEKINSTLHPEIHVWVILKNDLENMNTSIANKSEKVRPSTGIRPSTAKKPPTILTKSRPQTAGFFKKVL